MTVEQFDVELAALVQKIDAPLADALCKDGPRGRQCTAMRRLPDRLVPDAGPRPSEGYAVFASVSVWIQRTRITYESKEPAAL
jgi:hypothetical protein